jgi:hypothetical protein
LERTDFAKRVGGKSIRDLTNLCLVLKNIDEAAALVQIVNAMESDIEAAG